MKERDFVEQNSKKWREFELLFNSPKKDPRRLTSLFVQITEDLAYARTFYGNRSVRVYLNQVSQRVFQSVYKGRKFKVTGFRKFWSDDLPDILWHARFDLLIATLVFGLAVGIGILSGSQDSTFAQLILGDEYVAMTEANIESGDPMNVYKDSPPLSMFFRIWTNNLRVSVMTFVMGIAFSVGTLFVLLFNGIMVGSVQFFFIERGLFQESFLTIFQHGTLELSAIVISGAAGLTMGRGLIFPGTYTRSQAIRLSAKRGIKIMVPVFFMLTIAAVIESWVTRHTEIPDLLRLMVVLASLGIVLFYFVWYPRLRYRAGMVKPQNHERIPAPKPLAINLEQSKGIGVLFTETFGIYRSMMGSIMQRSLIIAFVLAAGVVFYEWQIGTPFTLDAGVSPFGPRSWIRKLFAEVLKPGFYSMYYMMPIMYPINVLCWWGFQSMIMEKLREHGALPVKAAAGHSLLAKARQYLPVLLPIAILHAALFIPAVGWGRFLFLLLLPLMLFWSVASIWEDHSMERALNRVVPLLRSSITNTYVLLGSFALLSLQILLIVNSPLLAFYLEFVQMNLPLDGQGLYYFEVFVMAFLAFAFFYLLLPLTLIGMSLAYWNARENRDAAGLKKRLERFGNRKMKWI